MRDQGIPLPSDPKPFGPVKKTDTVVLKPEINRDGANEAEEGKPQ